MLRLLLYEKMIQIDTKIFPKTAGAFIVGGSIRDLLCGRSPMDYDVAVLGDPHDFARQIKTITNGHLVEIGRPGQTIIRVISDKNLIDVSKAKDASIEKDLLSRDFTINAMAYDLSSQRLIDPMGAQRDLGNRIIRMVSKDIFKQDPVRLLRAYRIAAEFGFEIESKTKGAIKKNAARIRQSAGERVREELFKILRCAESHPYLCQMADSGLLFAILPELMDLNKCRQNRHHQFNAFEHTLHAFYHLERLLTHDQKSLTVSGNTLAGRIVAAQIPLLKFSILVHDIGKPAAQTADRKGRLHFYGHERQSAQMTERICRRLKCANRDMNKIDFLVRHHARPRLLYTAIQEQNAAPRATTQFFMKCAAHIAELLILAAADMLAKAEKQSRQNTAFMIFLIQLMRDYESDFKPRTFGPRLITGQDLIADFGLNPSPLFKKILDRVEEERLSKSDMTRQQAVELVKRLIRDQRSIEDR